MTHSKTFSIIPRTVNGCETTFHLDYTKGKGANRKQDVYTGNYFNTTVQIIRKGKNLDLESEESIKILQPTLDKRCFMPDGTSRPW